MSYMGCYGLAASPTPFILSSGHGPHRPGYDQFAGGGLLQLRTSYSRLVTFVSLDAADSWCRLHTREPTDAQLAFGRRDVRRRGSLPQIRRKRWLYLWGISIIGHCPQGGPSHVDPLPGLGKWHCLICKRRASQNYSDSGRQGHGSTPDPAAVSPFSRDCHSSGDGKA
jgi:hypothetical protein